MNVQIGDIFTSNQGHDMVVSRFTAKRIWTKRADGAFPDEWSWTEKSLEKAGYTKAAR